MGVEAAIEAEQRAYDLVDAVTKKFVRRQLGRSPVSPARAALCGLTWASAGSAIFPRRIKIGKSRS
jgi:hypothetical protein